jgi:uncharacterized protein (TIGR03437 family)
MTIGNPQRNSYVINARLGVEAIVGSTTESLDNTFDFFIAIPAPTSPITSTTFSGTYYVTSMEFPIPAGTYLPRSAYFSMAPSSSGLFSTVTGLGHALNISNGAIGNISITGANYALASDGSGTASFGSVNNYLSGLKNIFVSASGNIVIMGSVIAASQDLLIGVRANSASPALKNWTGTFYTGGLRYDGNVKQSTTSAWAGASDAIASLARLASYQRYHQVAANSTTNTALDASGYEPFTLNNDSAGTFTEGFNLAALGTNGTSYVENNLATNTDVGALAITFGIQIHALSGTGVYIDPQGVFNGATFAPIGGSIAPGEFLSIFGSGLAANQLAATPPYPTTLGDVSATVNGIAAPMVLVSANQINLLVPYAVTGATATIVITNGGSASNSVTVPLAATAPGVFSQDSSGTGIGAILRANNTKVSTTNPAKRGETIQIYLTGLGAVSPAVPDGSPGTSANKTVSPATVYLNGQAATVVYSGLAPGSPGLYQLNVTIPSGLVLGSSPAVLGIFTANAFTDTADIPIQ